MKTLKWAEIANPVSKERYSLLSEALKAAGVDNEVSFIESSIDSFSTDLRDAKQKFDQLLIGNPFTELAFDPKAELTSSILHVRAIDALSKTPDGHWWPRSILHDAFIQSLAHKVKVVDMSGTALIVGAVGPARAVITALGRIGFTKFNLADRFQERGQMLIKDLRRSFFNMTFEFVPQSGITALPGMHSLLVNCTPFNEEDELLQEMQYFNFLKEGGSVVDLVTVPPKTPLLVEAEHIGARIVRGDEVAAAVDLLWAQLVTGKKLELPGYDEQLYERLSKLTASAYKPPNE
ncbi:MAG TPA: hypothetical protein VFV50_15060 [Bdellovibrionales bacterium]|nr:hypothetical protein [Bdellovibrionales bacterium]